MRNIVLLLLLTTLVNADQKYTFCAPVKTINQDECSALQRGESEIVCLPVADSAECSIRLAQGQADFGVFNAEELLLAYPFYQSDIVPIQQLRHRTKLSDEFEFQTVAVVRADLTQIINPPGTGFGYLKNGGLCHPGFSKSQWWNDYILKYFEKTVNPDRQCQDKVSVIENEVRNLRSFFGKACRPGEWASESSIDQELKRKYSELCVLCDNQANCTYNNKEHHGHLGALNCLINGRGGVAYVALNYVNEYLRGNKTFEFLCPNGSRLPLTSPTPCTWIRQPWSVVAARTEVAEILKNKLPSWLKRDETKVKEPWKWALSRIIQEDSIALNITENLSLTGYLTKGRVDVDFRSTQTCDRTIRWCTIGDMDTNKCNWMARAAIALGIEPRISCVKSKSVFECLRRITDQQADIITIDSNYGYVARKVYGLTTVLYCETEKVNSSKIVAAVREPSEIKSFQDLKGRTACFPEYAGISWLSFVNTARKIGIVSSKSCDYPLLMSKLFSGACTPGIKDRDHSRTGASADVTTKLCSACSRSNNTSCAANDTNRYYNDNGAMRCLTESAGDVAFVEVGNINEDNRFDPNNYRILCKNGSLASNTGFHADDTCALSVTIDSEVIGRKNDSQTYTTDIFLALLKMEEWLGYRVGTTRPLDIYGPFNGTRNLVFKDSTSGLVSTSSTTKTVEAYKDLFSHVYQCSTGHLTANTNFIFIALVAFYHLLSSHA
ncbi:PREDICTED: transferrin-like isoform X2 [Dinoponera quadriceps]|uniref:Transferrin n=1 Tax=Dinoponera quadriceps TaxID=609295 RepID=A0A6P3XKP9_DINQU|nr:PREDICTED: transferrin-like isoform X2 [Dinoponera quadriceps]